MGAGGRGTRTSAFPSGAPCAAGVTWRRSRGARHGGLHGDERRCRNAAVAAGGGAGPERHRHRGRRGRAAGGRRGERRVRGPGGAARPGAGPRRGQRAAAGAAARAGAGGRLRGLPGLLHLPRLRQRPPPGPAPGPRRAGGGFAGPGAAAAGEFAPGLPDPAEPRAGGGPVRPPPRHPQLLRGRTRPQTPLTPPETMRPPQLDTPCSKHHAAPPRAARSPAGQWDPQKRVGPPKKDEIPSKRMRPPPEG